MVETLYQCRTSDEEMEALNEQEIRKELDEELDQLIFANSERRMLDGYRQAHERKLQAMTPEQREEYSEDLLWR